MNPFSEDEWRTTIGILLLGIVISLIIISIRIGKMTNAIEALQ